MGIEKHYSVRDVAEALNVAEITVRIWLNKGKLGYVKAGGRTLISQSQLDAFIEVHEAHNQTKGE